MNLKNGQLNLLYINLRPFQSFQHFFILVEKLLVQVATT